MKGYNNFFQIVQKAEYSLTPNLDYFTPTFSKVTIEKYGKTPFFSGKQHFYFYYQNPSENSGRVKHHKLQVKFEFKGHSQNFD